LLGRSAWITENAHVRLKQLFEAAGGKPLRIVFTFAGTVMLLVNAVVMVAKLVHENVQECERSSLRFREPTYDALLLPVIRNTKPLKNMLVSIEVRGGNLCPKVVLPRMKENRSRFLSVVKLVETVQPSSWLAKTMRSNLSENRSQSGTMSMNACTSRLLTT
jgi:hypothetical protein